MPNQRKKGTKLAGDYIDEKKDKALEKLAKSKGYKDKAAFLRAVYDTVLSSGSATPDAQK
jgi:hypothetical protein